VADEKVTKHSGYVYNSKTREGFQRMKRHGIVMPPFRIEDTVTKLLTNHYDRLISRIEKAAKGLAYLEKAVADSTEEYRWNLQDSFLGSIPADKEKLARQLAIQLDKAQLSFFDSFVDDAPQRVGIAVQFALDKDEVFQSRLDGLMETFLKNSIERVEREENFLKSSFLMDLNDYVLGKSKDLNSLKSVIEAMRETSTREARFFARDQFARLNKAMTVTSIEQAGAKKVQWWTCQDGRVRATHAALNKKMFDLDNLPDEINDYGCRCGLVPVFDD
jgi:SPP1 gp7 family putative phage head morphogenesis protein